MNSAWVYKLSDGRVMDSEMCSCFRHTSVNCAVHGKDPHARLVPRHDDFDDTIEEAQETGKWSLSDAFYYSMRRK